MSTNVRLIPEGFKNNILHMEKTIEYIKEVIAESKKVTWPTRRQTISFTLTVLVISIVVAYYLGLLDFLFGQGLKLLLTR